MKERSHCLLVLPLLACLASLSSAATFNFEGSEYSAGQVLAIHDTGLPANSITWQPRRGTSAVITAAGARPATGARCLRLRDELENDSVSLTLDANGTLNTVSTPEAPVFFTVGVEMAVSDLSPAHFRGATTGSDQLQFYFGWSETNQNNSWFRVNLHQNSVNLYVRNGSTNVPVSLGVHNAAYVKISATIDPATRTYVNVTFNGRDVTSLVRAASDGGKIPCAPTGSDPNTTVFITTGTDDKVIADIANIRLIQGGETWISAASPEWLPYITGSTTVKVAPNSALNLNQFATFGNGDIDTKGRIKVGGDGDLVYADGSRARLFCAGEVMHDVPINLALDPDSDGMVTQIDDYVNQLVYAGYNCFRPHFLDRFLMQGSTQDGMFSTSRYRIWQRLVSKLREKGIYLYLDATSSWCSFYAVSDPGSNAAKLKRLKTRVYWDMSVRNHWKAGVKKILTETNPFNQKKLAEDPQLVAAAMRNEAGLMFQLSADSATPALRDEPLLKQSWITWLKYTQTKYATITNLNDAWNLGKAPEDIETYASFDTVPLPAVNSTGTPLNDLQRFAADLEIETSLWMQATLRDAGTGGIAAQCLLFDYNSGYSLPNGISQDIQDIADIHVYHDHGTDPKIAGVSWRHSNTSSFDACLQYYRSIAQTRQWGKPLTVTEWGNVFWNPWRHEGGLAFPSYASLQGFSLISQFAHPVELTPKVSSLFWIRTDPPCKAAEYMAAFLYRRGDVSMSQNRIDLALNPEALYSSTSAAPWPVNGASLLCRVGRRIVWNSLVRDEFDDTSLATVNESNLPSVSSTSFWNSSNSSPTSLVGIGGGDLILTPSTSGYPSAIVRSPMTSALNFFAIPMTIELKNIRFDTSAVAPAHQRIRIALTSQSSSAFNSEDAIMVDASADNKIKIAYKLNAAGTNATTVNCVKDITDLPSALYSVTGLAFTPIVVDMQMGVSDPSWELGVYYKDSLGKASYKRYNGRWHTNTTYAPLTTANWAIGAGTFTGMTAIQVEAQKTDGVVDAPNNFFTVRCGTFRIGPVPSVSGIADFPSNYFRRGYAYPLSPSSLDFADVVAQLRASGVLSGANATNPNGAAYGSVFHSDTEELLCKPPGRFMQVKTAKSEGVTLPYDFANQALDPGLVTIDCLSVQNMPAPYLQNPVTVFATSLDNLTLANSKRMLLILSGDALNSGQMFTDYTRTHGCSNPSPTIKGNGELPILLKRSKVALSLKNINASTAKVYPLRPDGTRHTASLPSTVRQVGSTKFLDVTIDTGDTATMPEGPAVYFEIVAP